MPPLSTTQQQHLTDNSPANFETKLGELLRLKEDGAHVEIHPGQDVNGTVTLTNKARAIIGVLAFVTSTGAAAAKALLAVTTDYVLDANGDVTCKSDQQLNTLVVIYQAKSPAD